MLSRLITLVVGGMLLTGAANAAPTVADSLKTEKRNGRQYISHKVEPKETLFGLSKRYNVSVDEIVDANPKLQGSLVTGQTIRIPVKTPAKVAAAKTTETAKAPALAAARTFTVDAQGRKWHEVAPGQTFYSIANLYNLEVEELKKLNSTTAELKSGQKLIVGKQAPAKPKVAQYVPEKDDELEVSTKPVVAPRAVSQPAVAPVPDVAERVKRPEREEEKAESAKPEGKLVHENGLAAVINTRFQSNKFLALHRTAPIGTMLQVKNTMSGRSVYVRVIGQLPDTGENDRVIVKLSRKACQSLGVLDARFHAEVAYMQ